jgi:RNA polymerase sigma factor (sigma-70 family)
MTIEVFLEQRNAVGAKALEEVYVQCRSYCISWLRGRYTKYDTDAAKDLFMEAVLILWDNASRGKIQPSQTQVSSYLTTVCRNLATTDNKTDLIDPLDTLLDAVLVEFHGLNPDDPLDKETLLVHLESCIKALGTNCKKIIEGFYLEGKSLQQITEVLKMDYNVIKAMNYNCKKSLKNCILSKK